jgi:hypothetical protein
MLRTSPASCCKEREFMKSFGLFSGALFTLSAALALGCRSASYAERGAVLGGLAGAATGAAIGNHNGNTGAGAVIGTAVGALTGAAVGDSIDEDVARNRALIEQQMGRRMAEAVTIEDVIAMHQNSLSDGVIITHIRGYGVAQRPQVNELITLRNHGVSDAVIQAMQETPPPQAPSPPPPLPQPRPVVIEEHYYGPPLPPYWRYRPHHIHRRHRGPGFHWGFSFGS